MVPALEKTNRGGRKMKATKIFLVALLVFLTTPSIIAATGSLSVHVYESGGNIYADVYADCSGNLLADNVTVYFYIYGGGTSETSEGPYTLFNQGVQGYDLKKTFFLVEKKYHHGVTVIIER